MSDPSTIPTMPLVPTLTRGTLVEVSDDETFTNPQFGFVVAPNNGRPHIFIPFRVDPDGEEADTNLAYGNCVHQDDPDLHKCIDTIRQTEMRGVYRLAQPELERMALQRTIAKIVADVENLLHNTSVQEQLFTDLQGRVALLEKAAERAGMIKVAGSQSAKK